MEFKTQSIFEGKYEAKLEFPDWFQGGEQRGLQNSLMERERYEYFLDHHNPSHEVLAAAAAGSMLGVEMHFGTIKKLCKQHVLNRIIKQIIETHKSHQYALEHICRNASCYFIFTLFISCCVFHCRAKHSGMNMYMLWSDTR